jgi:hypothetical protein
MREDDPMPLSVRHTPWPQPEAPAPLPTPREQARGLSLTDRAVYRDGVAFVPVSGELHYSRIPRARWTERLEQLRAAGVTLASTYVFWNHHVPQRGAPRFDGELDVAAFVDAVAAAGLELVLRIGPWAHGEARNGGFPDWVQDADVRHRSDDPAYLTLVREWFGQLAKALGGRARPGGPIIAVQVENELYDRPDHLTTLIGLAREAGIAAPLWTATAWGGAELPAGEVVPLFGGYADGFWVDPQEGWQPNFRAHFFPSHDWDDPGVGEDVRASQGFSEFEGFSEFGGSAELGTASRPAQLHGFPPATCELGSGMATAYHRRPVLAARDIAALAHVKIGNGSAWQGYYMFAGGRNPARGLQESQDTGYPNDITEVGYDFHAPIGESGDLQPSAALLRAQHTFLSGFGDRLARMTSSLPEVRPGGLSDRETLRWALRSDGGEGFVLISHHQPYEQVADAPAVQLEVRFDGETLTFPSQPVDIPAGTLARWPVGLRLGSTRLSWVTASALTVLPAPEGSPARGMTLVVAADPGVPVEVAVEGDVPCRVGTGIHAVGDAWLLVLDSAQNAWVRGDQLYETDGELRWNDEMALVRNATWLRRYDPTTQRWIDLASGTSVSAPSRTVPLTLQRPAGDVPADYGFGGRRHRAPLPAEFEERAAVYGLDLGAWDGDAVLDIDWAGDIAQLRVDDVVVDDRMWDGERWSVSLTDARVTLDSAVTLHLLPLSTRSTVWLPERAVARRAASDGALGTVDRVTLRTRGAWHPVI